MDPMHCQALLFDLDGTLVDSTEPIERVWRVWSERREIPFESLRDVMHGRPAAETIRMVAPHLQPELEIDALELDEIAHLDEARVYPGAIAMLQWLDRHRWAIVTSGSRRVAQARLKHMGLPVPRVLVTANDILAGKPAPDCYVLAASQLGILPNDCVVIEDSPVGVTAAKAAGMRVIAIASTHDRADLISADLVVAQLTDLSIRSDTHAISIDVPR